VESLLGNIDTRSLVSWRFAESERWIVSLVDLEKDGMAFVVFLPRNEEGKLDGKQ
jgi:hypothetical protein